MTWWAQPTQTLESRVVRRLVAAPKGDHTAAPPRMLRGKEGGAATERGRARQGHGSGGGSGGGGGGGGGGADVRLFVRLEGDELKSVQREGCTRSCFRKVFLGSLALSTRCTSA